MKIIKTKGKNTTMFIDAKRDATIVFVYNPKNVTPTCHITQEALDKDFEWQINHIRELINKHNPDRIVIDETGLNVIVAEKLNEWFAMDINNEKIKKFEKIIDFFAEI